MKDKLLKHAVALIEHEGRCDSSFRVIQREKALCPDCFIKRPSSNVCEFIDAYKQSVEWLKTYHPDVLLEMLI